MTCKDCIHCKVCFLYGVVNDNPLYKKDAEQHCSIFKNKSKIIELPTDFNLHSVVYVLLNNDKVFYRGFLCGVSLNNENKTTYIVFVSDRVNFKNGKIEPTPIKGFYDYFLKLYSQEQAEQALRERENK